ncbi:MAG: ABC transporter permease [Microbacteriaceae bacterium]
MSFTSSAFRVSALASRLARHLGGILLVVWGAATAGFIALKSIPGDPVSIMLGVQSTVSESVKSQLRTEWGLDEPPLVQYFLYLTRLASGDLGTSYQLRQPVASVIGDQLGATLALTSLAIVFALLFTGASALLFRGRVASRVASSFELVLVSAPTFWTSLLLLGVFVLWLGWLPLSASRGFPALVLPALALALPVSAVLSQLLRQGVDAAERSPFALTARARGISRTRLFTHHTLRHASVDTITLAGYIVGSLLGGAVLVETVFARPGIGRVMLRAIIDRDLPVVLGIIVVTALVFAVIAVVVDVISARIDPRLRAGGGSS